MDAFRWVLLIIGVFIFLLIYVLSKKRNPVPDKNINEKISPVLSDSESDAGNVLDYDDKSSLDALAENMRLYHSDDDDGASVATAIKMRGDTASGTADENTSDEKMIVMYLVEKHGGMLSGADIFGSLEQVGLRYGEMKIFHYYSDLDSSLSPPVFSMANLVDPGWFDLISIDKIKTPGLTLFMRLPGPLSSIRAFDEMLDVINKLEQLIPVALKDKSRNKISKQMLMHMREEVVEFDRIKNMQPQK
jgi:cell division protein ZipA